MTCLKPTGSTVREGMEALPSHRPSQRAAAQGKVHTHLRTLTSHSQRPYSHRTNGCTHNCRWFVSQECSGEKCVYACAWLTCDVDVNVFMQSWEKVCLVKMLLPTGCPLLLTMERTVQFSMFIIVKEAQLLIHLNYLLFCHFVLLLSFHSKLLSPLFPSLSSFLPLLSTRVVGVWYRWRSTWHGRFNLQQDSGEWISSFFV